MSSWNSHHGAVSPVPPHIVVEVMSESGETMIAAAEEINWRPDVDIEGRIVSWRHVAPRVPAPRPVLSASEPVRCDDCKPDACPCTDAAAPTATAIELCDAAADEMRDRASTYDKPAGERSMAATVLAFNAVTGHVLIESEGWLFMELLKAVRDYQRPGGHLDSQVDRIAYAALAAEARRAGR